MHNKYVIIIINLLKNNTEARAKHPVRDEYGTPKRGQNSPPGIYMEHRSVGQIARAGWRSNNETRSESPRGIHTLFTITFHQFRIRVHYSHTYHHRIHLSGFVLWSFHRPTSIITGVGVETRGTIRAHLPPSKAHSRLTPALGSGQAPARACFTLIGRIRKLRCAAIGWNKTQATDVIDSDAIGPQRRATKYPVRATRPLKG